MAERLLVDCDIERIEVHQGQEKPGCDMSLTLGDETFDLFVEPSQEAPYALIPLRMAINLALHPQGNVTGALRGPGGNILAMLHGAKRGARIKQTSSKPRGRKKDDGRRVALWLAYSYLIGAKGMQDRGKIKAKKLLAKKMAFSGERAVRRKLNEDATKKLLANGIELIWDAKTVDGETVALALWISRDATITDMEDGKSKICGRIWLWADWNRNAVYYDSVILSGSSIDWLRRALEGGGAKNLR